MLIKSKDYSKLKKASKKLIKSDLIKLFSKDLKRYQNFNTSFSKLNFDFSKNFIDNPTKKLL
ncbi:MAG: hypothetical protein ACKN9B_03295, partial [Actinomycetes bacterium]